jgi:hypothetical protein
VSELLEQRELLTVIREAINRARGEIYFVDLHTTSAHGQPFATVGWTDKYLVVGRRSYDLVGPTKFVF